MIVDLVAHSFPGDKFPISVLYGNVCAKHATVCLKTVAILLFSACSLVVVLHEQTTKCLSVVTIAPWRLATAQFGQ